MATHWQRERFGEELREAMAAAQMNQRALAKAAGVTPSAVSQWTLGQTAPRPEMVAKLEGILSLPEGTLGRWLGYTPASVSDRAMASVIEAIEADPRLGERERELLTAMYRQLVRQRGAEQGGK